MMILAWGEDRCDVFPRGPDKSEAPIEAKVGLGVVLSTSQRKSSSLFFVIN